MNHKERDFNEYWETQYKDDMGSFLEFLPCYHQRDAPRCQNKLSSHLHSIKISPHLDSIDKWTLPLSFGREVSLSLTFTGIFPSVLPIDKPSPLLQYIRKGFNSCWRIHVTLLIKIRRVAFLFLLGRLDWG